MLHERRSPSILRAITGPITAIRMMRFMTHSRICSLKGGLRASTGHWCEKEDCIRGRRRHRYPGVKYPTYFYFFATPMPGHTPQEVGDAIHAEIERLKKEDISDEELKMVKTRAKANLIRSLDSNDGLAQDLAVYQTLYGDWRELFESVDRIDAVTKADIRRVANRVFVPTNRTVGVIETAACHQRRCAMKIVALRKIAIFAGLFSAVRACTSSHNNPGPRFRFLRCPHSIPRNPNGSCCRMA